MVDSLQQALLRAQRERQAKEGQGKASRDGLHQDAAGDRGSEAAERSLETGAKARPLGPGASLSAGDAPFQRSSTQLLTLDRKHLHRNRIATDEADDPLRAPFDMLRTKVVQRMKAEGWKTLAVVSPDEGEGKTVASVNLALSIAKLPSQTAMLLDLDFRKPGLLSTLGHTPPLCMDDWLAGSCDFTQTLFSPGSARVVASGVRAPIAGAAEMLASRRVATLIDDVACRYDDRIVVVDMPPMLRSDDALVLIPHIDCFLMVVAAGQTLGHRVKESLPMIPPERFLGTVLNKSLR
jgi:Mrp family chromosome partitioning ATPase